MTEGAPRAPARNPVLATGSRVPAWAALAFTLLFCAGRVMASGHQPLAVSTPLGVAWWLGVALVIISAVPQRVEVAAEGLRIAWIGRPRVIRYDAVVRAEPVDEEDVLLTLASGEPLRLCRTPLGDDAPRAILERMWSTLAAGAEAGARPVERAALARGSRSVHEWLEALRELGAPGSQYRQALAADRLLGLALNPAERVPVRAAAAVAALPSLGPEGRAELARVAATTIEATLRDALTLALSSTDDATLAAALRRASA